MGKRKGSTHLFVLVHGLWGGAGHLKSIEDVIRQNVVDSKEDIHILRPKSSSLFKTYDGIEIIGQRMLQEIFDELKELDNAGSTVTKISVVGYSLGGLVSRYIIGELERMNVFDHVDPQYFATFATPHLGTWFFKKRFRVLNFLGSNLIGLAGSQLFIKDQEKILVKLSEGVYIKGLTKFKKRFAFANIRHDRTVNFYTSFITSKNPFDANWDKLDLKFDFKEEKELPTYKIRGVEVKPRIVNFEESTFRKPEKKKPATKFVKKLRWVGILLIASVVLPIWLPFVITASTIGSLVSFFIVKYYKKPDAPELNELITLSAHEDKHKDSIGLNERIDEAAGEAIENVMNIGQYDAQTDSARDTTSNSMYDSEEEEKLHNTVVSFCNNIESIFKNPQIDNYEIFRATGELPLDSDRQRILRNLNELDWIKFGVYVNVLNAHDGIVARKGLKRSTVKGIATVTLFSHILNEEIKNSY